MKTLIEDLPACAGDAKPLSGLASVVQDLIALRTKWRGRIIDRRHLQRLEDHVLADMGVSRAEVEREAQKPFWRPLELRRGGKG